MGARTVVCVAITGFLLAGCAASLHPVAPQKDRIFDQSLLGRWKHVEKDVETSEISVEKEEPDGYRISYVDEGETINQIYSAQLFRLGEAFFYDVAFSGVSVKGETVDSDALGVYRTHYFGRVWIQPNEIRVGMLNESWLEKALDEKRLTLKFEKIDSGWVTDILLTGPSEEVRAFAQKYADDKDAFSVEALYRRQK